LDCNVPRRTKPFAPNEATTPNEATAPNEASSCPEIGRGKKESPGRADFSRLKPFHAKEIGPTEVSPTRAIERGSPESLPVRATRYPSSAPNEATAPNEANSRPRASNEAVGKMGKAPNEAAAPNEARRVNLGA
jgi:hypothetical protein